MIRPRTVHFRREPRCTRVQEEVRQFDKGGHAEQRAHVGQDLVHTNTRVIACWAGQQAAIGFKTSRGAESMMRANKRYIN